MSSSANPGTSLKNPHSSLKMPKKLGVPNKNVLTLQCAREKNSFFKHRETTNKNINH